MPQLLAFLILLTSPFALGQETSVRFSSLWTSSTSSETIRWPSRIDPQNEASDPAPTWVISFSIPANESLRLLPTGKNSGEKKFFSAELLEDPRRLIIRTRQAAIDVPIERFVDGKTWISGQISIDLISNQDRFYSDPGCKPLGIFFGQPLLEGKPIYFTGARCQEDDHGNVVVTFHHPENWIQCDLSQLHADVTPDSFPGNTQVSFDSIRFPMNQSQFVGRVGFRSLPNRQGQSRLTIPVYLRAKSPPVWFLTPGVSYTFHTFSQDSFRLSQSATTGKITLTHRPPNYPIDFGINAFYTLTYWGVASSNSAASGFRFLGVNARLGYRFPGELLGYKHALSFGFYLLKMSGPSINYGISQATGPQIFWSISNRYWDQRNYSIYFKFVPIMAGTGVSFSNRELALGGAFQLTPKKFPYPIAGTFDVSQMALISPFNISSSNYSLGIQATF